MTVVPEPMLTRAEVAVWLSIPKKTLTQWAYEGRGPKYVRAGNHARYRRADVEAWLAAQPSGGGAS